MTDNQMITRSYLKALLPHFIITACVIIISHSLPALQKIAAELSIGSLVSMMNFTVICWALKNIFIKKRVALSVSIIVFKWPILGLILYELVVQLRLNALALIFGLASIVPAVLGLLIFKPDIIKKPVK